LQQALKTCKGIVKKSLVAAWSAKNALIRDPWRIPVLGYHSVNSHPNRGCDPLPPAVFEEHLEYLAEHHNLVRLEEVFHAVIRKQPLPPRSVAVTFDDGYLDTYEVVFPLLEKYRVPATVFVVTGFLSGEVDLPESPEWPAMSWDQAREMDASPIVEIDVHTHTHPTLSTLDAPQPAEEIRKSKEVAEAELGRPVDLFAYPYGQGTDIPQSAIDAVEELGFTGACSTFWRSTHKHPHLFMLHRVEMNGWDTVADLKRKLAGGYDFMYYLQKARALYACVKTGRGVWRY
jgi:peptidoglycan/xylan/chitin deacetylase (PgdA/CDA1 family)